MKQSIVFGMEKVGVPSVTVCCNGINMCFLIDTGSAENHLVDYVYQYFTKNSEGIIKDLDRAFTTSGVGWETHTKGCTFSFTIGRTKFEDEFVLLPNIKVIQNLSERMDDLVAGILGGKFLENNHIVIDYESKCIYTKRVRKNKKPVGVQEAA